LKLPLFFSARWSYLVSFALGVICTLAVLKTSGLLHTSRDFVLWNPWDTTLEEKVVGKWLMDDLRTPEIENTNVVFGPRGVYRDEVNSPHSLVRWFSNAGVIYFSTNGSNYPDGKDYVFSVVPDFDDAGDTFSIAFENAAPHCRLVRASKS